MSQKVDDAVTDLVEKVEIVDEAEVWKPIAGYEGLYEVSSFGRIKTVEHKVYNPAVLGDGCYRTVPEKIRRPNIMKGYHCICLQKDGDAKVFRIHRLVAEAFIGPQPSSEYQVNHIDGDKSNNHAENLEWVTPMENTHHAMRTGLRKPISEETRRKIGKASQKRWKDPDYRSSQSEMQKRMWAGEERHQARSMAIREGIHRAKEARALVAEG